MLAQADDESVSPPIFSNQVQISISSEEVVLDFYRAGPARGQIEKSPHMAFVQRIIMPPSAAAMFADVFAGLIKTAKSDTSNSPDTSL